MRLLSALVTLLVSQYLVGPPQTRPFEALGHKTGWVMLEFYEKEARTPAQSYFEIVDESKRAVRRIPVKGDRIRILMDLDLFVAGYWRNGRRNQGDPLVSPADVLFDATAASHAKIAAKTELVVEDVATDLVGGVRVLWARVSPIPEE